MSGDKSDLMHPAHARIWELLPWYLNESLEDSESIEVRKHLGECLVCRRELDRLGRLAAAVSAPVQDHACNQAFARLSAQIHHRQSQRSLVQQLVSGLKDLFEPVPLLAGASVLVVSSVLVAGIVLSGQTEVRRGEQPFQTLGQQLAISSEISHPLVRVVLRDGASDTDLDAWLVRHSAELVDGPSEIGVLTVRVATGARPFDTVLETIRADRETVFIEPVQLVGTRPDRHR